MKKMSLALMLNPRTLFGLLLALVIAAGAGAQSTNLPAALALGGVDAWKVLDNSKWIGSASVTNRAKVILSGNDFFDVVEFPALATNAIAQNLNNPAAKWLDFKIYQIMRPNSGNLALIPVFPTTYPATSPATPQYQWISGGTGTNYAVAMVAATIPADPALMMVYLTSLNPSTSANYLWRFCYRFR